MLRWYFQDDDTGALVEWPNVVPLMNARDEPGSDGLVTNAEEGSVGRARIRVEDPTGAFGIRGHRKVVAVEDAALSDAQDGIVSIYFTNQRECYEGTPFDGIGRVFDIDLDDLNTVLERRIMEGSDAKRPAETDVARVQWLFATGEMAEIESDAYLLTSDPENMSKSDYRGQRIREILDDVAQQSGKNWFVHLDPDDPTKFALWYGFGTGEEFTSIARLSNDPEEIDPDDETTPVYPIAGAGRTTIKQDPTRVFSDARVNYDGGSAYVSLAATAEQFVKRATIVPAENVKTKERAEARGRRELRDVRTEEHTVRTAIVVPAAQVNVVSWGHRVPFRSTWAGELGHIDYGQEGGVYCRVLNRTARQIAEGRYELALEMTSDTAGPGASPGAGSGFDGSLYARVEGSSGPYPLPSGPILWDKSLDEIGLPWWNTNGPFDYHDAPDRDWPLYDGIEITDDGTLERVVMVAGAIGVALGANEPYTVTWEILVNGSVVASESDVVTVDGASNLWTGGPTVIAENVAVSTGDVLSGRLSCSPVAMEMFRTPLGINSGQNYLEIRGGSFP